LEVNSPKGKLNRAQGSEEGRQQFRSPLLITVDKDFFKKTKNFFPTLRFPSLQVQTPTEASAALASS
jgi:hypothetical protein